MTSTNVEESPSSSSNQTSRRLNMEHGFVKFILRNQIDRDEYHKIQEKRKTDIKERLKRRTSAGAELTNCYVPPPLRRQQTDSDSSSSGRGSIVRSESDSQEDEKSSPTSPEKPLLRIRTDKTLNNRAKSMMIEDEKEEKIREGVRRRFERSSAAIDDLCSVFINSTIQDKEETSEKDNGKSQSEDLFIIQLHLPNGEDLSITVPRTAQAARLAKIISREHGFDDSQCRNLRIFIEKEMEKRTSC